MIQDRGAYTLKVPDQLNTPGKYTFSIDSIDQHNIWQSSKHGSGRPNNRLSVPTELRIKSAMGWSVSEFSLVFLEDLILIVINIRKTTIF